MTPIQKNANFSGINPNLKSEKKFVSNKQMSLSKKINQLFNPPKKDIEIFHLGGTRNPTFDPNNYGRKLDGKAYFYEQIPVQTANGEIHIYGNELKGYVEEWMEAVRAGKTKNNFQTWMAERSAEEDVTDLIKSHFVRYFGDEERKQTEIHIDKNGGLTQIGLDSKDDDDTQKPLQKGEYAFVVGEFWDKESNSTVSRFYATPKVKTKKGKIQHSSFLRGGNVRSAGMLVINEEEGTINIQNRSGHYKPSAKEMAYLIRHLKEAGFDISKLHVTYSKHQFFHFISAILKIDIKWGIVTQNAEKWFEKTGKNLINGKP